MPSITALLPMRHHSERVPGKNYKPFAGRPLYRHILDSLLACPEIAQIVIDTDSPQITAEVAGQIPRVTVIERPEHLRAGDIPMNEILLHDTARFPADLYLQTHSTNPLLRPETISAAIQALLDSSPSYDSLFAVTRVQTRLWDQLARPINHNPSILLRTQDLPPVFMENSCIYIFSRDTLLERHNRLGERPLMFEIPADEAWDIDTPLDFEVAEFLMGRRGSKQGN